MGNFFLCQQQISVPAGYWKVHSICSSKALQWTKYDIWGINIFVCYSSSNIRPRRNGGWLHWRMDCQQMWQVCFKEDTTKIWCLQFLLSVRGSCKVYREQIIFHGIYKNLLNYTLANHTLLNHTQLNQLQESAKPHSANQNLVKHETGICLTALC